MNVERLAFDAAERVREAGYSLSQADWREFLELIIDNLKADLDAVREEMGE